ncbi:hypothetical protein PODOV061v2_0028 [Vibrio phage 172P1]|nr:hypothetical protein PODOV061v2_0028 [Vibrio phage 172P1]
MNGESIVNYLVGYANELCLVTGWDLETTTNQDNVHILFKCDHYAMGTSIDLESAGACLESACDILDEVVMDFTKELKERGIEH